MRERPILFSGPMVRAILEGRKTQTRRIVGARHVMCIGRPELTDCPYGEPGDRLWVREKIVRDAEPGDDPSWCGSFYDADGSPTKADAWPWKRTFLPPLHCPRGLSRITLRVTSVRVERLQNITEEDAAAEGVAPTRGLNFTARHEFAELWDEINGKRAPWASNPFVWVIGFEREVTT